MITLGIAGFSGSGKTTLVIRLIPELMARGLRVSTVKHTHHSVVLDRKGNASRRLRRAGASEVLIAGNKRWALLHELQGALEPDVEELVRHMTPVDLVLVEGFKRQRHEKIEVHRPALGKPLLYPEDDRVMVRVAPLSEPSSRLLVLSRAGRLRGRAASFVARAPHWRVEVPPEPAPTSLPAGPALCSLDRIPVRFDPPRVPA